MHAPQRALGTISTYSEPLRDKLPNDSGSHPLAHLMTILWHHRVAPSGK